jgi:hypothetical protein
LELGLLGWIAFGHVEKGKGYKKAYREWTIKDASGKWT